MLQNGTGHGNRLHISNNNKESKNKATKKMRSTPGEVKEPSAAGQGKGWSASTQWFILAGTDVIQTRSNVCNMEKNKGEY
jgi:hypothetical protein